MASSHSKGQKGRIRIQDLAIAEDVKISIEKAMRMFLEDDSTTGEACLSLNHAI